MRARSLLIAMVVALVASLGLAVPAHAATLKTISFKTQLTNTSDETSTYGNRQYGTATFEGSATIGGEQVQVRRDSVINYVSDNGSIGGFVTVTWKDGSRLSMEVSGSTLSYASGASFNASLEVFSATGRWKGYIGHGIMRGGRTGALGTVPDSYAFQITLSKQS